MIIPGSRYSGAGDPYWSDVVFLMNGGTLSDATGKTVTAPAGGVSVVTTDPDFPYGCILVNGTAGYLQCITGGATQHDFNFGTGDFFFECTIKTVTSTAAYPVFLCIDWLATAAVYWQDQDTRDGAFTNVQLGGVRNIIGPSTIGNVYALAIGRQSGVVYLFINGNLVNTIPSATYQVGDDNCGISLGNLGGSGASAPNNYNGKLSNIRITKGVCRFTANYTAPASPFPTY